MFLYQARERGVRALVGEAIVDSLTLFTVTLIIFQGVRDLSRGGREPQSKEKNFLFFSGEYPG